MSTLAERLPKEMAQLTLRPLFIFEIDVAKPNAIGKTPGHDRRVGEITGGSFDGERLRGKILSGGSDWQTVRDDASWTLDVRLVLETDDHALIGMTYKGIRHGPKEVLDKIARGEVVSPSEYYLRAAPRRSSRPRRRNTNGSMESFRSRPATGCRPGRSIRCSRCYSGAKNSAA